MKKIIYIFALLLVASTSTHAIDMWWIGPAGTQAFNNPANWSTTDPTSSTTVAISPPSAQDDIYFVDASFPAAGNYDISITGTQNVRHIRFQGLGSASRVRVLGSGTVNHYGDVLLLNDTRLSINYSGTFVETSNAAFSPSRRVYELQGRLFNPLVSIQLPTADTVEVISSTDINRQIDLQTGTFLISTTDFTASLLRFTAQGGAEQMRFKTNDNPLFLRGLAVGGPTLETIAITGVDAGIDFIDFGNSIINLGTAPSNRLIRFRNETNTAVNLNIVNHGNDPILDRTHVRWKTGSINKLISAGLNLQQYDATIDTLELISANNPNLGTGLKLSLEAIRYPTLSCGEYINISDMDLQWMGNLPACVAFPTNDSLIQFALSGCQSLDNTGTVLTGNQLTSIFEGKDETNNAGFDFLPPAAPRDLFWIGGTGDWDDITHWSLSSGGAPLAPGSCPPLYVDNVFFDANSFSANGETMSMTKEAECHNMTWDNLAFTDIDWLGTARFNLYGSMQLDVNMVKNLTYGGDIHLWGTADVLNFEAGSVNARYMPAMDLFPRKFSHYDIVTYGQFRDINYGSNQNGGSPTYLSFADTIEFRTVGGGGFGYTRPGGLDTIDMDKNSSKWIVTTASSLWGFRANPKVLHNPNSWIITEYGMAPYQCGSSASDNGRWPNTLILPGGTVNQRFANWVCMNFHISGEKDGGATTQSSYTFMNISSSTGGIDCIEFRTLDTIVDELLIGKNANALTVQDSFVFERVGGCLDKNVLSGATASISGIRLDPSKVRMTGTEIIRFDYNGTAPPWDAGVDNFDGGGLTDIIFGPPGSITTYYWRQDPSTNSYNGDWSAPNNWTTNPNSIFGQGPLGCAPTAADSVVIDQASGDGANYTIDANTAFSCLAFNADSARSGITLTGNGNLTIGGTLRVNDDIDWNYSGDMFVTYTGTRFWASGDQSIFANNIFLNGGGVMQFDGSTSTKLIINGRLDMSANAATRMEIDSLNIISMRAIYGPSNEITALNVDSFRVFGSFTPTTSASTRGINLRQLTGTNTRLFVSYTGFGSLFSGNVRFVEFLGGNFRAGFGGIGSFTADTISVLGSMNTFQPIFATYINASNPALGIDVVWEEPVMVTERYTSLPNSTFEKKLTVKELYLQSDRTHTFSSTDTTFFLNGGDLAKIGDLSKVITFRSTNTGTRAFLHKPFVGNIYLCNIDARDVEADVPPNSALFRTNSLSVLNNSPGWDVLPVGGASNITAWDTTQVLMFRGDSTTVGFNWDPSSTGPYRVFYFETNAGLDSIQVNDGVFTASVPFGGFSDSTNVGQTASKHFECPGFFVPDSVDAAFDSIYINVPETENGLSAYNRGGRYYYKNLDTWVYMMDSVDLLTTAAFYDKTAVSDVDSLGFVTTHVDGQATTIDQGDRFYMPRYYEMQAANNVATRVTLFFSTTEIDLMQASLGNVADDSTFLACIKLSSFPNGQLFNKAVETDLPYTVRRAPEVNANTFAVVFDAPELASFAMFALKDDTDGDGIADIDDIDDDNDGIPDNIECPLPSLAPASASGQALSWQENSFNIYATGNNSDGTGYINSGWEAAAQEFGAITVLDADTWPGTNAEQNLVAPVNIPFSGGNVELSSTTNGAVYRDGVTGDEFKSSTGNNAIALGHQNGVSPFTLNGGNPVNLTATITFTNPVIAFGLDLIDQFDTQPANSSLETYDIYVNGRKVYSTINNALGSDVTGNVDVLDGAGNTQGTITVGNNTEAFIGIIGASQFIKEVRMVFTMAPNNVTASRELFGMDNFHFVNFAPYDNDNDGIGNHVDLDSDNDGISDLLEANGVDADRNGLPDDLTDTDQDGLVDIHDNDDTDGPAGSSPCSPQSTCLLLNSTSTLSIPDNDGDDIRDYLDGDSDNDGIMDNFEGQSTAGYLALANNDFDRDGIDDNYDNTNAFGGAFIVPENTENTTLVDYLDTDTDDDAAFDWAEGFDNNGDTDAAPELIALVTAYEANGGSNTDYPSTDTDNDNLPDWLDESPNSFGYDPAIRPPFLDPTSPFWFDVDNDGIADLVDPVNNNTLAPLGTEAPRPDNNGVGDRDWRDNTSVADLPVELVSFNAKRINPDEVKLDWSTATELNNKGFYIERMLDIEGVFETIGFVEGAGTSTNYNYYNTIDENSYTGISYYRLKQIDYDGSFKYSEVRAVEGIEIQSASTIGLTVFPNPTENNLKIRFEELPNGVSSATIRVIDVNGKTVHSFEADIQSYQVLTINKVAHLTPAMYLLSIQMDNGYETSQKFIKN